MTTNITERDKKLLYGLGLIVIVALFFIIAIRPLSHSIAEKEEKIEKEQITHDVMQTKIQYIPVVQAYVENMTKNVESKSKRYYDVMDSSKVDKLFTGYAINHNLIVSDLSITMPSDQVVFAPYPYSEAIQKQQQRIAEAEAKAALEAEAETKAATASSKDAKKAEAKKAVEEARFDMDSLTSTATDTSGSGVFAVDVGLSVYGKKKNIQLLIDELMRNQSIHVASYSWGDDIDSTLGVNADGTLYTKKGYKSMNIQIKLMMYDPDSYQPPKASEK